MIPSVTQAFETETGSIGKPLASVTVSIVEEYTLNDLMCRHTTFKNIGLSDLDQFSLPSVCLRIHQKGK